MDTPDFPLSNESLLEHAAWVRRLAMELVRDAGTADDLVQETWLAFLRARPDTARPLKPWLARVVRNAAALRERRNLGRAAREQEVAPLERLPATHELIERAEEQRRLASLVLALDEPYRETLLLRYYEGLTPTQIARATNVPAPTVRTRLHRGIERLRMRLDQEHGGDRKAWLAMLQPLLYTPGPLGGVGAGAVLLAASLLLVAVVVGIKSWKSSAVSVDGVSRGLARSADSERGELDARSEGLAGGSDARTSALEPEGARQPVALRTIQLVGKADGQPLAHFAVQSGARVLTSDERGRLELAADITEVRPFDHADLGVEELVQHALSERRALTSAPVPLPGAQEGDILALEVGLTLRLDVDVPAACALESLQACLGSQLARNVASELSPRALAPVRTAGAVFDLPWVRFAAEPRLKESANAEAWLELRDAQGLWWGAASFSMKDTTHAPLVPLQLHSTGAVHGRVAGLSPAQLAETRMLLLREDNREHCLAWTVPGPDGVYDLRWILPGRYEVRVLSDYAEPMVQALVVYAGEFADLDFALLPVSTMGAVAGRVRSTTGRYEEQLLVFLIADAGSVVDVFPTTWEAEPSNALVATFRFESVPVGVHHLNIVSLADNVTFRVNVADFSAPCEDLEVTLLDERPAADWSVAIVDAKTSLPIEQFDFEVRVDCGEARVYRRDSPALESGGVLESWTLLAGGLRWNQFESAAPLRRLPIDAQVEFVVRAKGFAELRGSTDSFQVLATGQRHAALRLSPR